ncbi:MAG: hypothetical protein ACTS6A_00675 [Candidatus Hodgkinia cicadicola]
MQTKLSFGALRLPQAPFWLRRSLLERMSLRATERQPQRFVASAHFWRFESGLRRG